MQKHRVVITGLGVVSPAGTEPETFFSNLISGKDFTGPVTLFDPSPYTTNRGGQVRDFDPKKYLNDSEIKRRGRGSLFSLAASRMALAQAGIGDRIADGTRTAVVFGTTMGEAQVLEQTAIIAVRGEIPPSANYPMYPCHVLATNVATALNCTGPAMVIPTACAAGNYAIGYGYDLICNSRVDMALVGGSDPLSELAFTGFSRLRSLTSEVVRPFDKNRKGILIGEGAGVLLLESESSALRRGAEILAEVRGYGLGCDAFDMTTPHPHGEGAFIAATAALKNSGVAPEEIGYISAHGTGTKANDKTETYMLKRLLGEHAYFTPVSSIKSIIGHTMGAASALEAVACVMSLCKKIIPPTINYQEKDPECDLDYVPNIARQVPDLDIALSDAFAFGGNDCVLILSTYR